MIFPVGGGGGGQSITVSHRDFLTLCILMDSSFLFDAINLGYFILHI